MEAASFPAGVRKERYSGQQELAPENRQHNTKNTPRPLVTPLKRGMKNANLSYHFPPILTDTDNLFGFFLLAQRLTIATRTVKISIQ